jgi:hypothetical protein
MGMKGMPCAKLAKALRQYRDERKRGALMELSQRSGVSHPVLYRIAGGRQKTITYDSWNLLYKAEPDHIPPPGVKPEESGLFSDRAILAYPSIEIVAGHANDAAERGMAEETFLELVINSLKNELIMRRTNGGGRANARA